MAIATADQVADKWSERLSAAQQAITDGVNRVTQSPMALAAAKANQWQQAVGSARAKEKYVSGLNRTTLTDWKSAMLEKGVQRIATGATAAKPKMRAFMAQFLPFVDGVAQRVRAMPKVTLEDGIARATAQIRGNAGFKRS